MPSPSILTIILNYRTPDLTLAALDGAVRAMEGLAGGIVVVDNASGDGSLERIAQAVAAAGWDRDARVRVHASPRNGGFGAGMNEGIRQGLPDGGRPDYVYLLNSDACPAPDAIRILVERMEAKPHVGLAGSSVHGFDGVPHATAFRFPSALGELEAAACIGPITRLLADRVVALPIPEGDREVDWVSGASLLVRRAVIDTVGGFDEGYFLYFEETDLCLRARRAGFSTLYVRESRVAHEGSASTGMKGWTRVPSYWLDSRRRYFLAHHGRAGFVAATLARLVGMGLNRTRLALTGRPVTGPRRLALDLAAHAVRGARITARSRR